MRHFARLLLVVCLSVALAGGTSAILTAPAHAKLWAAPKASPDTSPRQHLNEFENRVLIQVNKRRARADLRRVKVFESCVDRMSERWARRIKRTGKFVHRDQTRVLNRCDLMWTGETLVRGGGLTPRQVVRLWMRSASHRAVIMKKRARWAGIGTRVDGSGRIITVLNFGDAS